MFDRLTQLLDASGIPHGYCIAWEPRLLWTMVVSNALIAGAYFTIPFALNRFLRKQPDVPFGWMFVLFSAFIFFCGVTHLVEVVNIWRPTYRLEGALLAITAGFSVATALALFPLVPKVSNFLDEQKAAARRLTALNEELRATGDELAERNRELNLSELRFRKTFEGAPIGLALVGIEDGRLLEVNRAFCAMLGYGREEMVCMNFQQITHPDDLKDDLDNVARLLRGEAASYRMTKRYFAKDGRTVLAILDVTLIRDESGMPLYFISQIQDITERQRIELALRESERLARALNEMDELLQVSQALHEIGPPVARACIALYPGCAGVVYLRKASENWMESLYRWGDPAISEPVFAVEECWSIRRGQPVAVRLDQPTLTRCAHIGLPGNRRWASLCLPMVAQGTTLGLLHLQVPTEAMGDASVEMGRFQEPAERVAAHAAIAIANLQLRETLRRQSIRDPLTGLFNRRHLEESLARDLARADRDGSSLAVLMIDVDHFKRFNDEHGHAVGDLALKRVGETLSAFCRQGDLACRYGGEEFTVVLTQLEVETALARAESLRHQVSRIRVETRSGALAPVTVSIGVALYPLHAQSLSLLIDRADEALYAAKQAGRDRVCLAEVPQPTLIPPPI